ncbi:MAG: methionyl-tRNA formyltransferase [Oligoflexales bacterium]|nr:methionyl-tRNA formyltransferase [Oligoflexales bacterium]
MRIVYMGSPASAVKPLAYLLEHLGDEHELLGVVSQPAKLVGRGRKKAPQDPPVAQYAKERQLAVLQPQKARDIGFLEELKKWEPDLMVTCAYGQILSEDFLAIPKRGTINIHPSRLPLYRGATPIPAALLSGESSTAVTILFTVKALDAGNIITQKEFSIGGTETAAELTDRLFFESGPLLMEAIAKLKDSSFVGTVQDESKVTHCRKIYKNQGFIDWNASAKEIYNRFRAFYPWPGSYTYLAGKRVLIESMSLGSEEQENAVTQVRAGSCHYDKNNELILIKAGVGCIGIQQMKASGSKSCNAKSFWNGHCSKVFKS